MSPTEARERAGLSLEDAAKKARVCARYLRDIERRGGAGYGLAMRLSRLYGCSANLFLYGEGHRTARTKQTAQRRQTVT